MIIANKCKASMCQCTVVNATAGDDNDKADPHGVP